jgi:hypothetical protein
VTFFLVSAIIGILLGLRFNVFVLLPATLIAACAITAAHYDFGPPPSPCLLLRRCFRSATSWAVLFVHTSIGTRRNGQDSCH